MGQDDNITHSNYLLLAAKAYNRPNLIQSEFDDDIGRLTSIKRLVTKYTKTGVLKERFILNHLVVFTNVFSILGVRIIFLKMTRKELEVIKPFLVQIGYCPHVVTGINGKTIHTDKIKMNRKVIEALRQL